MTLPHMIATDGCAGQRKGEVVQLFLLPAWVWFISAVIRGEFFF